ncbi:10284_t:CDS:10 [Entrophospora sp. SA101]|nr:10284_t:CDS:10 [Entrophospora sp. SA101]
MSSAVSRAKTRRQEANLTPRTQILPNSVPSSANHHNNNHNHNNNNNMNNHNNNINNNNHPPISSGPNSYKPIEQVVYDEIASRHMHDRMLFLFSNLVGMNVVVTLKSGVKYQGFFRTACTDGEMGVVLRLARRILSKNEEKTTPNPAKESFIILAKDLMDIHATNVDFFASERPSFERDTFRTDSDITDRTEIRERELHKWTPDESGENILENGDNSWDQFEVNRQLFGITTDFNEEIYTTKLDRSKPDFKEREKAAIALANEINRTTTTNVHMLEERGHIIDESQIDEEQLYGAVARRDPSKYMPPAIRKQLQEQQKQQQQPSSPPPPSQPPLPIPPSSPDNNNNKSEPLSNGTTTTTVTNTTATTNKSTAPVQKVNSLAKFRITEPIEVLLTKVPRRNNNNQSSEGKKIETQMETQIVKTFRQFANNEKERLQQRKQAIFKKEMDGKLNSPLPQDLIPILTNDESKRQKLAAKSVTTNNEKTKDKALDRATLKEGFSPFHKGKPLVNPSSIAPIWNYGTRPFRHHFVTSNYDEEIYPQATVNPGYGFTSYPVAPPFRYPNAAQYGVVPQMPLQQPTPMPYMQQGFVPGVSFPTPPIPQNGAPPIYNQMQTIVPQHFGSQGFPSPGRTPMVPAGMHPQIYQPYQNPHAIPQMMRYPHEMVPQVPPNGVILGQRPMMMEPHYVPQPENNQMGKLKN